MKILSIRAAGYEEFRGTRKKFPGINYKIH